ncbi:MAG: GTP-binding protein [Planctomycetes bacterium]|nr:GTP-binding protein [Planctomycetota bacterium]
MSSDPLDPRTPVTLLTGWLGAGKTTLLNRILCDPQGQKFAVLVNEFGDIGIDHRLIVRSDDDVVELSNGCVCCSVRGDLVRALKRLGKRRWAGLLPPKAFDRVILETTGIAEPAPLLHTFLVEEEIAARYRITSITTLIDGAHAEKALTESTARDQVALADLLILNKQDLISGQQAEDLAQTLRQWNPSAPLIPASFADIDPQMVLEERPHQPMGAPSSSRDHVHQSELQAVTLCSEDRLDPLKTELWFNSIAQGHAGEIVRWKGFLHLDGHPERGVLQGTYELFNVAAGPPWSTEARRTELVMIGRDLNREALERGLSACKT